MLGRENTSVNRCVHYPLKMLGNNDTKRRLMKTGNRKYSGPTVTQKKPAAIQMCRHTVLFLDAGKALGHKHDLCMFIGETETWGK